MNLLVFHLEANFGEDLKIVANNEVDLEDYLIKKGFKDIKFSDLRENYGTCSFRDGLEYKETAKCSYMTKI
jgi:hypothetical protein|tara:strand:- start:654 stop:866 length:213 start_codon:yes stop_codon:yes gene_type:complete